MRSNSVGTTGRNWAVTASIALGLSDRCFGFQLLKRVLCAPYGFLHILADVVFANQFFHFRIVKKFSRLLSGAAQNQRSASGMQGSSDFFNREQAGGIECRH